MPGGGGTRGRVALVGPPLREEVEPDAGPAPGVAPRVAGVLELLAAELRSGTRQVSSSGVLLDVVVEGVRCVLFPVETAGVVALSPRERQIARMVAAGRTNQAIASTLDISAWTVSTHVRRIFAKLAVSSRAEMVAHMLACGDLET